MPFLSPNQQCRWTCLPQTYLGSSNFVLIIIANNSSWLPWGGLPCLSSPLDIQTRTTKRKQTAQKPKEQQTGPVKNTHTIYILNWINLADRSLHVWTAYNSHTVQRCWLLHSSSSDSSPSVQVSLHEVSTTPSASSALIAAEPVRLTTIYEAGELEGSVHVLSFH